MYLIIDNNDKIMCAADELVYTKIQESNGLWACCDEREATAVYAAVQDKHYAIKTNVNDGVVYRVAKVRRIPDDLDLYEYYYRGDDDYEYIFTLDDMKTKKQKENKQAFREFLATQSITWTDGKKYGVTEEDQSEISLNLAQYQISSAAGVENPTLEWHAIHEECVAWEYADLSALALQIAAHIYPYYHKMQQYKTAIYGATSPSDLLSIVFEYGDVAAEETESAEETTVNADE